MLSNIYYIFSTQNFFQTFIKMLQMFFQSENYVTMTTFWVLCNFQAPQLGVNDLW